jgi:hypothetical protein
MSGGYVGAWLDLEGLIIDIHVYYHTAPFGSYMLLNDAIYAVIIWLGRLVWAMQGSY